MATPSNAGGYIDPVTDQWVPYTSPSYEPSKDPYYAPGPSNSEGYAPGAPSNSFDPFKKDEYGNYLDPWGNIITDPERIKELSIQDAQRMSMSRPVAPGWMAAPEWKTLLGDTGVMQAQYQTTPELQGMLAGPGMQRFQEEALSREFSPWVGIQEKKLAEEASRQRDILGRTTAGQAATGESALAMGGGLTSGARERLQQQAGLQRAFGAQDIGSQQMMGGLDVQAQDIAARRQMLTALPGMESQRASMWQAAKSGDIDRAIREQEFARFKEQSEAQAKRDFLQKQYELQMQQYGKEQEARAQALNYED